MIDKKATLDELVEHMKELLNIKTTPESLKEILGVVREERDEHKRVLIELQRMHAHNKGLMEKQRERRWVVCAAHEITYIENNVEHTFCIPSPRHSDPTHHSLYQRLDPMYQQTKGTPRQGFLDNWGIFMDREEAYGVAEKAGQIRFPEYGYGHKKLFSEMLY